MFKNKKSKEALNKDMVYIDVYDAVIGEHFTFLAPKNATFTYPETTNVFEEFEDEVEQKSFVPRDMLKDKENSIQTVYLSKEQEEFLKKYSSCYWKKIDLSGEPFFSETRKSCVPQFGENLTYRQIGGIHTMLDNDCKKIILRKYKENNFQHIEKEKI